MNKSESKYFNTARKMDEAFLELLERKDFPFITVKEICEKAGVNRSTFYLHYETVGDLLSESMEYMHGQFLERFRGLGDVAGRIRHCPREELVLLTPSYLRPYLEFIQTHQRLYRASIEHPEIFAADMTYQKMFRNVFDPILERFSVPTAERNYRMIFYLQGIQGIVAQWLKEDCAESMDALIQIIQRCVLPSAQQS